LKKIFIIRHAKSDQGFFGNDFERPLNDRGKADAPLMAKRLMKKQEAIDALVSSPATRAKKTAESFSSVYGRSDGEIIFVSSLYHAAPEVFYEVIGQLAGQFTSAALFSHNPGITYFVNSLVPGVQVDNMPTCAIFAVQANINQWSEFEKAKKEFLFFDYPKKN